MTTIISRSPIASSSSTTANWAASSGTRRESPTPFCRVDWPPRAATLHGEWQAEPAPLVVPGIGELHLWRRWLEEWSADEAELATLLSDDEWARAERFKFAGDRQRFIVARAWLRQTLARYLGCGPRDMAFRYGPQGKPHLADSALKAAGLAFNLSHADSFGVLAIARRWAVGVDVERVRDVADWASIAAHCYSPPEQARVQAAPPELRSRTFLEIWTGKEAWAKARGLGLDEAIAHRDVAPLPFADGDTGSQRPDQFGPLQFSPAAEYVAAVAGVSSA